MKRVRANIIVNVSPKDSVERIANWVSKTFRFYRPDCAVEVSFEPDVLSLLGDVSPTVRRYSLLLDINVDESWAQHFHGSVKNSIQKHFDYLHAPLEPVVTMDSSYVDGFSLLGDTEEVVDGMSLLDDSPPDGFALLGEETPPGADLLS